MSNSSQHFSGNIRARGRAKAHSPHSSTGPMSPPPDADQASQPPIPGVHDERYGKVLFKTRMCSYFQAGHCVRRVCRFAHSEEELRHAPDWSKTVLCHFVRDRGYCRMENCKYAHTTTELREDGYGFDKSKGCFKPKKRRMPDQGQPQTAHGEGTLRASGSAAVAASAPTSFSVACAASAMFQEPTYSGSWPHEEGWDQPYPAQIVGDSTSYDDSLQCGDARHAWPGMLDHTYEDQGLGLSTVRPGGPILSPDRAPFRKMLAPLDPGSVDPGTGVGPVEAFPPTSSTNSGFSSYPRPVEIFDVDQVDAKASMQWGSAGEPAILTLSAEEPLVSPQLSCGDWPNIETNVETAARSVVPPPEVEQAARSSPGPPPIRPPSTLSSALLNFGLPQKQAVPSAATSPASTAPIPVSAAAAAAAAAPNFEVSASAAPVPSERTCQF